MAGAAFTAPFQVSHPSDFVGNFPIKSGEIVNQGDLVGVDTNGQIVVATKATGGPIKAVGMAFFDDANGTGDFVRTGVAALTVKASVCRRARISGLNSTLVPSIDDGLPVYLGEYPDGTASNYTCAQSTTAGDKIEVVGYARSATAIEVDVECNTELLRQDAANTTIVYG